MAEFLEGIAGFVWGPFLLIPLLLLTGLYLTVMLRGIQFHKLTYALWLALIKRREEGAEGDISHYQALTTALAATIGVGATSRASPRPSSSAARARCSGCG